jgi:hypothetical protein
MEMREPGRNWWHFLSIPENEARLELMRWRQLNPSFQFRVLAPPPAKKIAADA